LTWADNASNEDGYRVERSTDNVTFTVATTLGVNASGFADAGRTAGQTYYYRVGAYNTGGVSGYSNTATVAIPPSQPAVTYLSDLTWDSATNGWGPVERDKSNGGLSAGDGRSITLNGVTY
jgi:hypothetical protein